MIELGQYNHLCVARDTSAGLFLEDDNGNEVLLPGKFMPEKELEEGDYLSVFVYKDNQGRYIATTQEALITIDNFALLEVREVGKYGAFMIMGIDKDLLVPFMEQNKRMETGEKHLVYMYLDGITNRLTGSAKIEQFLEQDDIELEEGQEVEVLFWKFSDLGLKVIINETYEGLIYKDQLFDKIRFGDRQKAYIHHIRPDGKIDVRLQKEGYAKVEPNAAKILEQLKNNDGFLLLTDKSSPEDIREKLGMSKKTFKKSIGSLYKQRLILLGDKGIRLV